MLRDIGPENLRRALARLRSAGHLRELIEITTEGHRVLARMNKGRIRAVPVDLTLPSVDDLRQEVAAYEGVRWPVDRRATGAQCKP